MLESSTRPVNGIDLDAVHEKVEAIGRDPALANVQFRVSTHWAGQTRSESRVTGCRIAGEEVKRDFRILADEPVDLLGTDTAPNPQELLMSAVNACMMVGYVAQAALRGIRLERCMIETEGELDLRGFLGLDENIPAGYRRIDFAVTLEGDGTPDQYREIHEAVLATSPNFFNLARPVEMNGRLLA